MDLNKGVPTSFVYCEKLIWKFFFTLNQSTCPWMAFAYIFSRIFLIFLRGSVWQIIHREYIVFRDLNISCSLATGVRGCLCECVGERARFEWSCRTRFSAPDRSHWSRALCRTYGHVSSGTKSRKPGSFSRSQQAGSMSHSHRGGWR